MSSLDTTEAVAEFSLDGMVIRANANYLRLFGYTEQAVMGRRHSLFCSAEVAQRADYRDFWEALRRGEFRAGELARVADDGHVSFLQGTYNPVLDEQGRPVSAVKFAHDITAPKLHALRPRPRWRRSNAPRR